jgi:hypothetical protein
MLLLAEDGEQIDGKRAGKQHRDRPLRKRQQERGEQHKPDRPAQHGRGNSAQSWSHRKGTTHHYSLIKFADSL